MTPRTPVTPINRTGDWDDWDGWASLRKIPPAQTVFALRLPGSLEIGTVGPIGTVLETGEGSPWAGASHKFN